MINGVSLVYAKIETEMSGPIWPSAVCDENLTGQQRDPSYRCNLR